MVPAPNHILFDYSYKNANLSSIISLLAHEMIHIRQLKRMGNERFACQYSKFILNGQTNEIEKEAYDFQRKVDIDINNYHQSVMIRSDKDTSLYFNAVNGARHDGPLALRSDCTPFNLDCRWIFRDRMIVSAKDTELALNAVNGARHLAHIRLRADCKPSNPDCTWGYGKKMFISDNNRNLPMNAVNGARHDGHIYLHQDCVSSNPDCTWSIMQ